MKHPTFSEQKGEAVLVASAKPSASLFRSTSIVSLMTFISRMMGFLRDMLVAHFFGATASVDAFYVAFKLPNFLRGLFAEGAFSQAFVPVLSEYHEKSTPEVMKRFVSHVMANLGVVLLVITVLGMVFSPFVTSIFAPGFNKDPLRFSLASQMLQITFPYLFFISLAALSGSVLNVNGVFGPAAFAPVLLNIIMILAAAFASHYFAIPIMALAWGVCLAGVIQFLFLLPYLQKVGMLVRPKISFSDPGVRKVLKLMTPALFGASIAQINLLLDTVFTSFLQVGSVTWLYYANRISLFPQGVFGVAIATVVLPHLSRKHASQDPEAFSKSLDWAIRANVMIGLPAMIAAMVLAHPMMISLFQYGKFTYFDSIMTSQALSAYAFGLIAFMLAKVLSSAFYAKQDIKTPVRYAVLNMIINIILCLILMFPLKHAGLALATSIAAWLNVIMLLVTLIRRKIFCFHRQWITFGLRIFVASIVMILFQYFLSPADSVWVSWSWKIRIPHLFFLIGVGATLFILTLRVLGMTFKDMISTPK